MNLYGVKICVEYMENVVSCCWDFNLDWSERKLIERNSNYKCCWIHTIDMFIETPQMILSQSAAEFINL